MNTKEINGKHYIDAKVVMLAANKSSQLILNRSNKLYVPVNSEIEVVRGREELGKFQNIYIISNEEPQEGDWCVTNYGIDKVSKVGIGGIRYFDNLSMCWNTHEFESNGVKKIISSTDSSLSIEKSSTGYAEDRSRIFYSNESLPQPSKEFI